MMNVPCPVLELKVSPSDASATTLQQTKMVYDQLLADKYRKLSEHMLQQKEILEQRCDEFVDSDKQMALELSVEAQEMLNQIHGQCVAELHALRDDYQAKLSRMQQQLQQTG